MAKVLRRDFLSIAGASIVAPDLWSDLLKALGECKDPAEARALISAAFPQADTETIINNLRALTSPGVLFRLDPSHHPDNTIKPGQPLHFSWGVHDWRLSILPKGAAWGALPGWESARASLLIGDGGERFWEGTSRTPTIPAERVPRALYRLDGTDFREIELQVRQSPASVTYISGRLRIQTVGEEAPTWTWDHLEQSFLWKEGYTMSGTVRNDAIFAARVLRAVLRQDATPSENPVLGASSVAIPTPIRMPASSPLPLPFAPEIVWDWDNWRWFDPVWLVPIGNASRYLTYTVNLSATDDYDNLYQSESAHAHVIVYVAPVKRAALIAALTSQNVAIAFIIVAAACMFAPGYGWAIAQVWFGAAATAEAVAQFLAAQALDPPAPDPRYMELVQLPQKDSGQKDQGKPAGDAQVPSLNDFLAYASRVAQIPIFLSQIESKLMGAREAGDKAGIDMQTESYGKAIEALLSDTEAMMKLLPVFHKELAGKVPGYDELVAAAQSMSKGFPTDVVTGFEKVGAPKETRLQIEQAMTNPDALKEGLDVGRAVDRMAVAIAQLSLRVRDDTLAVFEPQPRKSKNGK